MFIPALGIGLGLFSGFSTGLIFNVIAENSPLLNNVSLVILITPLELWKFLLMDWQCLEAGCLSIRL